MGRALTRALVEAGHRVSVVGRRAPDDRDRDQPGVRYWAADLLDNAARARVLCEIVETGGKINHLVFLQRYRGHGDPWAGEVETTLTLTRDVIEALCGEFADGERAIVVVSSVLGEQIVENQSVGYHVVRGGLKSMVRYYAVKLGPRGIRVNGVAPCTFMKEESRDFYLANTELMKMFETMVPLGRIATSEDMVSVIQFLCGRPAAYVTGQVLVVDGGTSVVWHEALARKLSGLK